MYAFARKFVSLAGVSARKKLMASSRGQSSQVVTPRQSPINILTPKLAKSESGELVFENYDYTIEGKLHNNGYSIQFTPSRTAATLNKDYKLQQFHFHWGERDGIGSEHMVDSVQYGGELHIVHKSEKFDSTDPRHLAVVGVFIRVNPGIPICNIWDTIAKNTPTEYQGESTIALNVDQLLPKKRDYYHYLGSLTTPPYSETVQWYMCKAPVEVSPRFLYKMRCIRDKDNEYVLNNFRELQDINDRQVYG